MVEALIGATSAVCPGGGLGLRSDHMPIAIATPTTRSRSTMPWYGGRREGGAWRRLRCDMGTTDVVSQQTSNHRLSSSRGKSALTVALA